VFFGDCMSKTARTFSGFASIPRHETIKPRNLPEDTPKAHFAGLSFIRFFLRILKGLLQVANMIYGQQTLDKNIVDINFHVSSDLLSEHLVHQPLECCARVL
jgi:hypothetical protein